MPTLTPNQILTAADAPTPYRHCTVGREAVEYLRNVATLYAESGYTEVPLRGVLTPINRASLHDAVQLKLAATQ